MNWLEPAVILVLILINGFLAMSEMAVVSSRNVRLKSRAERGERGAGAALALVESPGSFLSTVQVGITTVGILSGAFSGATVAQTLAASLEDAGLSPAYSETAGVGIVVVVITYLSLVIGELAPKQIALNRPENVAARIAPIMSTLSRIAGPIVKLLTASTTLLLRTLGIRPAEEPSVTEDEVKLLIDQGTELGVFEPIEDSIVDRVFHLSDRRVSSLATPRTEILWLNLDDPPVVLVEKVRLSNTLSIPVAKGDFDHVVGFVRTTDLLRQCLGESAALDLEAAIQAPVLVPEQMPAFSALERFKASRAEIAFTVNEYGGIEGVVTLRDILEALVGELPEPHEITEPSIVEREDGSLLIDGMLPIHEFRERFDLDELPGEEQHYFQTLGGFVLTTLGRIPAPGDHFEYDGLRLEVVDMDGNRIDKVLVMRRAER